MTAGDAPRIAIVDYGMGNRRSVEKALEHVGARPVITREPGELYDADGLIVPGVGAFPRAMANLHRLGLDETIVERAGQGTPVLGICLGMQLLFDRSVEIAETPGLGLLPGTVGPLAHGDQRLPHIGWNVVRFTRSSPLTEELPAAAPFYHVHSFAARAEEASDELGHAEYGEPFLTAVERGTIFGVQFHPEKSSRDGLQLLQNFSAICARVAA